VEVAKRGAVGVTICSTPFAGLGRAQAATLGHRHLPILVMPHPFGSRTADEVDAIAVQCIAQLQEVIREGRAVSAARADSSKPAAAVPGARLIDISADAGVDSAFDAVDTLFEQQHWTDGLPVVPPTPTRVNAMLAHADRPRDAVLARIAPAFGAATMERVAINAVMAGLPPAALPVLVAAIEAAVDPVFNLQSLQTTTNPVAVWLIVNGPASEEFGFNASFNCLGEGNRANAALGRALRLVMRNIGGALPGAMDRATQGQPARYTLCCAENEAHSPWTSLRAESGFDASESTVTAVPMEGTINMNTHSKDGHELVRVFAATMVHPPSNEYVHGGEPWLLIGPEHADILMRAGYDKPRLQQALWEQSKMPAGVMAQRDFERTRTSRIKELGEITADTLLPIAKSPRDIRIVVAGGPGTHSVYVPNFGNARAVTVAIQRKG